MHIQMKIYLLDYMIFLTVNVILSPVFLYNELVWC